MNNNQETRTTQLTAHGVLASIFLGIMLVYIFQEGRELFGEGKFCLQYITIILIYFSTIVVYARFAYRYLYFLIHLPFSFARMGTEIVITLLFLTVIISTDNPIRWSLFYSIVYFLISMIYFYSKRYHISEQGKIKMQKPGFIRLYFGEFKPPSKEEHNFIICELKRFCALVQAIVYLILAGIFYLKISQNVDFFLSLGIFSWQIIYTILFEPNIIKNALKKGNGVIRQHISLKELYRYP